MHIWCEYDECSLNRFGDIMLTKCNYLEDQGHDLEDEDTDKGVTDRLTWKDKWQNEQRQLMTIPYCRAEGKLVRLSVLAL